MSTEDLIEGDIELPELDEAELNAILEEGDPQKIADVLAGKKPEAVVVEDDDVVVDEETVETVKPVETEKPKTEPEKKPDVEGASSSAEGDAVSQQEEEKPIVLTKDGKHAMPYAVVENLRERERQAREQLANALAENEKLKGGSSRMQAALQKHGIDVSAIEQGDTLTDEQVEALKELDPSVAEVIRVLNARSQVLAEQLSKIESKPVVSPEQLAVSRNADLNSWATSDPDRWDMAATIDDKLRVDPAWKDKSLDERFAEAARRTKAVFGDVSEPPKDKQIPQKSVEDIAAEKLAAAAARPQVPKSLTDVGATPQTERSAQEVFLDIENPEEMSARMQGMSKSQLKNLLAGVELVG